MSHLFRIFAQRMDCSLGELSLDDVLASSEELLLTCRLSIDADGWPGTIVLCEGRMVEASYQGRTGYWALNLMRELRAGDLEIWLYRSRWSSQPFSLLAVALSTVISHCEDGERSLTVILDNGEEMAEIEYSLGRLVNVLLAGDENTATVSKVVQRFLDARKPLTLDIEPGPGDWGGVTTVEPQQIPTTRSDGYEALAG